MRSLVTSTFGAAAAAALLGTLAAAQGPTSVPVNVQPPSAVDVVLFAAMNAGKVMATTDAMGKGNMDVSDLLNLGKLDVVEEKCPDKDRVLLVPPNVQMPDDKDCKKRRLGAFWAGHDSALSVKLQGTGLSTPAKVGLIAGGAAVGTVVAVKAGGGSDSQTSTNTGTGTGTGTSGPTAFNGNYVGTLTATTNTCGFSNTAAVVGILTVDSTGKGTWRKTHTNAGQTFNFNVSLSVSGSSASYSATTSQNIGSQSYSIADTATISGNSLTITQMFSSLGTPVCTVRYTGQLTKS